MCNVYDNNTTLIKGLCYVLALLLMRLIVAVDDVIGAGGSNGMLLSNLYFGHVLNVFIHPHAPEILMANHHTLSDCGDACGSPCYIYATGQLVIHFHG